MNAAIGTTYYQPGTHTLDALEGVARPLDQGELCFALRLQWVNGRRFDAFVADLHCSRVQRGAATIISFVSAPLVCVRRFDASAEGTDNPCSRAAMILLQSSSGQCRSRRGHSIMGIH